MIFDETYRPFFEGACRRAVRPGVRRLRGRAGGRGQPHRAAGRSLSPGAAARARRPGKAFASRRRDRAIAGRRRRFRLRRHARRSPLRRRQGGARGRQARAGRKALGALAGRARRTRQAGPQARRAGQSRLSQAARPRSQEAAHARGRRRVEARQQRLLLAAGAEEHLRRPVRRVDHRPQPGHLRRRALHQADRLHLRRPVEKRALHRPARPRRPGRRPDLGLDPTAADLRLRRSAARRRSTFTPVGSRPTIFPATSSRKCSSASTTACGTATAASAASSARSKAARRLDRKITINNHYNGTFLEPWGERSQRGYGIEVLERFVGEVAEVEFGGPRRRARRAAGGCPRSWPTTTSRPIARPWPRCRRWKPSSPATPPARPIAWSK